MNVIREFNEEEIILTQSDAYYVIRFFWPYSEIPLEKISKEDINFAQAILIEAIDANYHMGFVEVLWSWSSKPKILLGVGGFGKAVRSLAVNASRHWFKYATEKDLMNIEIYSSIKNTISGKHRSYVELRRIDQGF